MPEAKCVIYLAAWSGNGAHVSESERENGNKTSQLLGNRKLKKICVFRSDARQIS